MNRQTTAASPSPIRTAREAAGLSREMVAGQAGISLRTLERIEAGESAPRRATLHVLADALGVDPESLTVAEAA